MLFWLAMLISAIADPILKAISDRGMLYLVWIPAVLWGSNAVTWYYLYKTDKYLVLSAYYLFFTAVKDVLVSQLVAGDVLSGREVVGVALAFAGVCLMYK